MASYSLNDPSPASVGALGEPSTPRAAESADPSRDAYLDLLLERASGTARRKPEEILELAKLADDLDPVRRAGETAAREAGRRFWKAMMLAPDLETFEALLRGEKVPRLRLDPIGLARFHVERR